jgi:hypothetical protein
MFQAGYHHVVDTELFSLVDCISNIFAIGGAGNRFGRDIQCGVGKTVVEVVVEYGVAIYG